MRVYQVRGYPKNHYFVETFSDLLSMMSWMQQNNIRHLHESSGPHGYGFSFDEQFKWLFVLRWL